MNENENQFQELRRLLKLKQHEIPPPGYFNRFSGEVVARIRASEAARNRSLGERMQIQSPWLKSFLRLFESKPGVIGTFATSICLLLVLGVFMAEHGDTDTAGNFSIFTSGQVASANPLASAPAPQLMASSTGGIAISTNPVISLQPVATLFGGQNPLFQSANFAPAGH
jgi:hypothetical protein